MKPIVVHVTADTGLFGGKDRVLLWLLVSLQAQGLAQPVVVCFRNGMVGRMYRSHGLRVEALPMAFQFDVRAVFRLAGILRRNRANIVHTHDHKSHVLGRLAGRLTGVKVVSTLHGLMRDSKEMSAPKRALYGAMVRVTDPWTDWWIAVSRSLCSSLSRYPRVTWIPNGVDSALLGEDDDPVPSEQGPVILCMGRLSQEKGQDVLLEAAAQVIRLVPDAVVWLAGEGPTEPLLRAQATRLNLGSNVRFLGFREGIAPLLNHSAILALPSRGEGLPIAALEAMSRGIPVVATSVGGVPDLLSSPDVGVLVPSEDPNALGDALVSLLRDHNRARAMGEAGRAHVAAHFSARGMAAQTAKVYAQVLRGE